MKIAASGRAPRWRDAVVILLAATAGCAGGGPRVREMPGVAPSGPVASDAKPVDPAAAMDAAGRTADIAFGLKATTTAADLTRWSAGMYQERHHAEAAAVLAQWLSSHDDAPSTVRAALAVHLEALGQSAEAAAALASCALDDPGVARVRTWLNLRGDDFGSALADARRAADSQPGCAADRNNYGISLLYAGRPTEAREALLAAHAQDPSLPGALYNLAIVESVYFHDDEAARRWLAAYRRLDDADPDGLFDTLGGAAPATAEADGNTAAASAPALASRQEARP